MVISIISILSGIIIVSILGSKVKGRDAKRITDVASIQLALELYSDANNPHQYPNTSVAGTPRWAAATGATTAPGLTEQEAWVSLSSASALEPYLKPLPKDPQNVAGQRYYIYIPVDRKSVLIKTKLEKDPNLMKDDACPAITDYYDIVLGTFPTACSLTLPPNI